MEKKKITLNEYAKSKKQYITLKDGDSYAGIFNGFDYIEKKPYGGGEEQVYVRYFLKDLDDEKIRNFDSQSGILAETMAKFKEGTTVKIAKTGSGFDTKYVVESVV